MLLNELLKAIQPVQVTGDSRARQPSPPYYIIHSATSDIKWD